MSGVKRIFREPLFHFLVIGALIFVFYSFVAPRVTEQGRIVITRGQVDALITGFTRTWHRPPTQAEVDALVNDQIREEIASREAIELGLDKDDSVIRRRLMQKLEFINDAAATESVPTDDELQQFLNDHQSKFLTNRTFTFSQVFLDPDRHPGQFDDLARSLLEQLKTGGQEADISALGDPFLLDQQFADISSSELAKILGEDFVKKLSDVPLQEWTGPIRSGFGQHLIFVYDRRNGRVPPLADIHDAVMKEFLEAKRVEFREQYFADMLKRYRVTIEEPRPVSTDETVGEMRQP